MACDDTLKHIQEFKINYETTKDNNMEYKSH